MKDITKEETIGIIISRYLIFLSLINYFAS